MTSDGIYTTGLQPDADADEHLFDRWFDPIENAVRPRSTRHWFRPVRPRLLIHTARPCRRPPCLGRTGLCCRSVPPGSAFTYGLINTRPPGTFSVTGSSVPPMSSPGLMIHRPRNLAKQTLLSRSIRRGTNKEFLYREADAETPLD